MAITMLHIVHFPPSANAVKDISISISHANYVFGVVPQTRSALILQCMSIYIFNECMVFEEILKKVE